MTRVESMFVGDSITAGTNGVGGFRPAVSAAAPNLLFVGSQGDATYGFHEGYPGAHFEELDYAVLPNVDIYRPRVVIIMAGTNDVLEGVLTASEMITTYRALAELYLAKASVRRVLVGTIAPRPPAHADNAITVEFNTGLAAGFQGCSPGITVHDFCGTLAAQFYAGDTSLMGVDGVHPEDSGVALIATEIIAALDAAGVARMSTTTSAAIRDVMTSAIAALTPTAPGGGRFVAHPMRSNDFREWAEQNPSFRRFSVREVGPVEGPEVSNLDVEWLVTTFEIVMAYPLNNRTGPQMALDRDDAMEADLKQIEGVVGLTGFATLEIAAPMTVMRPPEREREQGQACAFNVLRVPVGYYRATS